MNSANSAALNFSPELESRGRVEVGDLGPVSASLLGCWYSTVLAVDMTFGAKQLSNGDPVHYFLESVAWIVGAGMGAIVASTLSRKRKVLVGCLSTVPPSLVWLVIAGLGSEQLEPLIFGFRPSVMGFAFVFMALTLLLGLLGGLVSLALCRTAGVISFLSIHRLHWLWLWIPMNAWVRVVPIAVYCIWLEIVTIAIHPALLLKADWDIDIGCGLMLGFFGIAALLYGVKLSVNALSRTGTEAIPEKRRVLVFIAGTVLLASIVSPLMLNWAIEHLKSMVHVEGTHVWWAL